jgi:hypothetical protein
MRVQDTVTKLITDHVIFLTLHKLCSGHAVAWLVEALCYKLEGRGFDSR